MPVDCRVTVTLYCDICRNKQSECSGYRQQYAGDSVLDCTRNAANDGWIIRESIPGGHVDHRGLVEFGDSLGNFGCVCPKCKSLPYLCGAQPTCKDDELYISSTQPSVAWTPMVVSQKWMLAQIELVSDEARKRNCNPDAFSPHLDVTSILGTTDVQTT